VTDSILTKLAVVVKDYSAYFLEEFKYFLSAEISTSVNNNYIIIGGKMQGKHIVSSIVYRVSCQVLVNWSVSYLVS